MALWFSGREAGSRGDTHPDIGSPVTSISRQMVGALGVLQRWRRREAEGGLTVLAVFWRGNRGLSAVAMRPQLVSLPAAYSYFKLPPDVVLLIRS